MDLAVVMRPEVLADKRADGCGRGDLEHAPAPHALDPGVDQSPLRSHAWPLARALPVVGDVFWNPRDVAAPYALIVDPRRWTPIGATPCPSFRGWRYLDTPPEGASQVASHHATDHDATEEASIPPRPP